jgi:hypothetical protein
VEGCGQDEYGSGQGPVAESCKRGNEPLGSIKGEDFLTHMSDSAYLEEVSAPQSRLEVFHCNKPVHVMI